VWLLEFFSTEVVLVVERERKAGGDDERGRGHLPGMGIEISNSTGAETWNRTRESTSHGRPTGQVQRG
jgi:hypothetical protein